MGHLVGVEQLRGSRVLGGEGRLGLPESLCRCLGLVPSGGLFAHLILEETDMNLKLTAQRLHAGGALAAALLCGACAATTPPVRQAPVAETAAACSQATLGVETVDASRVLRRQRGIPEEVHGAMIVEVLAGGPAARAGLIAGDVVERLAVAGADRAGIHEVNGYFDFDDALNADRCDLDVEVTLRRGAGRLTRSARPVESIPFYAGACRQGAATGCFRQGWMIAVRAGAIKVEGGVEELYDQACKLGSGAGCRELARLRSDPQRAADRRRLLERSCTLHHATGCLDLAVLYLDGEGVPKDVARATSLFVEACNGGEPAGCFNAGLMYYQGSGVAQDFAVAVADFEDACLGGSSEACANLGGLHEKGGIVGAASPEKAAAYFRRACHGSSWSASNAGSCISLGLLYRDGRGVPPDPGRAVELFSDVCHRIPAHPDDHDTAPAAARACSLLGAQFAHGSGVVADWGRAIELSKQGCDGADGFGCFNLGAVYLNGDGAAADPAAALTYFRRACEVGAAEGCFEAGALYSEGKGARRSDKQAATFYQKACDADLGKACAALGCLYAGGAGVRRDLSHAVALFARGCELDDPVACFNQGNHYADGTGVKRDRARAAALWAKACGGGLEEACAKTAPQKSQ
jgi:TPR repeat protein